VKVKRVLGTGSFFRNPLLGVMNLIALSTGQVLKPARMWRAYLRGCQSRNLYAAKTRKAVDADQWESTGQLSADFLEVNTIKSSAGKGASSYRVFSICACCHMHTYHDSNTGISVWGGYRSGTKKRLYPSDKVCKAYRPLLAIIILLKI